MTTTKTKVFWTDTEEQELANECVRLYNLTPWDGLPISLLQQAIAKMPAERQRVINTWMAAASVKRLAIRTIKATMEAQEGNAQGALPALREVLTVNAPITVTRALTELPLAELYLAVQSEVVRRALSPVAEAPSTTMLVESPSLVQPHPEVLDRTTTGSPPIKFEPSTSSVASPTTAREFEQHPGNQKKAESTAAESRFPAVEYTGVVSMIGFIAGNEKLLKAEFPGLRFVDLTSATPSLVLLQPMVLIHRNAPEAWTKLIKNARPGLFKALFTASIHEAVTQLKAALPKR